MPPKPGFEKFYGHGVYHCPYCDGWERRGPGLSCTAGARTAAQSEKLCANGIPVVESEIVELPAGGNGALEGVAFRDREPLPCDAIFFCSDCRQTSDLAALGCELAAEAAIAINRALHERTLR